MTTMRTYREQVEAARPKLTALLGRTNVHALPRITEVIVASGVGKRRSEKGFLEDVEKGLTLLTGQKPASTVARKSVAGFKVRKGQVVGMKCTLRGPRMNDFLTRLLGVALPRLRDFRGMPPQAVDAQGNLTIGISDAAAFPEVDPAVVETSFGLQVTVKTSTRRRDEAMTLFQTLGFPFADALSGGRGSHTRTHG